jgi:hypothetical protein
MNTSNQRPRQNAAGKPKRDLPPAPPAIFIAPAFNERYDDNVPSPSSKNHKNANDNRLRMTKAASEAARRANLSDDAIREVLEHPSQVGPDRDNPERTRFTKGSLVVVTGKDGVVLGVYKR